MKKAIFLIILTMIATGCSTTKQAVVPGMTPKEVQLAWNAPHKVVTNKNSCFQKKGEVAWVYFNTRYQNPQKSKYVLFKDGVVEDVYIW